MFFTDEPEWMRKARTIPATSAATRDRRAGVTVPEPANQPQLALDLRKVAEADGLA